MELPHVGQNCMICNRNDYLPFKCSHCDKIVCIDHKTNHGTDCSLQATTFDGAPQDGHKVESIKQKCDFCKKITLKLELTECQLCESFNCLYHRHQFQHSCPKLVELSLQRKIDEDRKQERQKEALNKLNKIVRPTIPSTEGNPIPKPTDPKKRALANRVRVMKLRQSAKGPPNILDQDKIFFEVKFVHKPEVEISNSQKDGQISRIFTTVKHTIGRMVDWSAEELGLVNKNHIAGAHQLAFEKILESGEILIIDSQSTFQSYLDDKKLENGDELIISYSLAK